MATGLGTAFGIDLNMEITAKTTQDNKITCKSDKDPNPKLMYECVDNVLKKYNLFAIIAYLIVL